MTYSSEDLLPLSGIQHFAFCRRQWALIHLEQQWKENLRTVEGNLLHRRSHDEAARERRGDTLTLVVPRAIGDCVLHPIPVAALPDWIAAGKEG